MNKGSSARIWESWLPNTRGGKDNFAAQHRHHCLPVSGDLMVLLCAVLCYRQADYLQQSNVYFLLLSIYQHTKFARK